MATLTDDQVDFIARAIHAQGIRLADLHDNLLDHICILVEQGMEAGRPFEEVLATAFRSLYRKDLYELEEEALFLASVRGPRWVLSRGQFFRIAFGVLLAPYALFFLLASLHFLPAAYDVFPNIFFRWMLIGCFWPLTCLAVIYLTPDRLDPLIPRHAKVLLGGGALIRVFRYEASLV
ncbi:MAG TPA: hypothetical protein VGM89_12595 [Puia sp.]|jgi:hypothetical protein